MKRLLKSFLFNSPGTVAASATDRSGLSTQILDHLPLVTLVLNENGTIIQVNEAVRRMLGWRPSELENTLARTLFTADEQQKLAASLGGNNTTAPKNTLAQDIDIQVFRKDGKTVRARMHVTHFDWQAQRYTCLSLRISAIENLELQLAKEQMLEFQQASDNKSRFLASVSHEIRTPLNGVLGMVDLLASSALDDPQRAYLSSLKKSARNLRALISNVLDFSKIEAGRLETELVPFDVVEILSAVVDAFSPVAAAEGIALQLQQTVEHKYYVGDPHRLSQVLSNLVSNALKFTEQGSVTVTASAQMLLSQNDLCRLTISVMDTGIGIAPEQQARIFDSFVQSSASVSRSYGGSGLGLYISKQLVALMGGELSVSSQPGNGSVFDFWIDLQPSYSAVVFTDTAPLSNLEPLVGTRILVVDDDLTNRTLLEAWLTQVEATVVCCSNGQEALNEMATSGYFDAVLMDVSMPVMDGLTTTRHIRTPQAHHSQAHQQYLADIPIIGISGHVFREEVARSLQAGMTACLPKPLSRVDVLRKLLSVLAPRQASLESLDNISPL